MCENIAGFLVKEDCIQFNKNRNINSTNNPKGPIVQAVIYKMFKFTCS